MALCEVIAELAVLLARERAPLSPRETYLFFVLEGMPHFRNVGRLDLWESSFQEVAPTENASKTEELLDELFELGRYNLYTTFKPKGTRQCYEQLREKLAAAGHVIPESVDLSNW